MLFLLSLVLSAVYAQNNRMYNDQIKYVSQIRYMNTPAPWNKDASILKPVDESKIVPGTPLFRKVYSPHIQPLGSGYENSYKSFSEIPDADAIPLELNKENMDFMLWEVSGNPSTIRILDLMRADEYLLDKVINSKNKIISSKVMDAIDLASYQDHLFFSSLLVNKKITGEKWAKIIQRSDPNRYYEESMSEIMYSKGAEMADAFVKYFQDKNYHQAYAMLEDSRISRSFPRGTLALVREEIAEWVSKSPFGYNYLLKDHVLYGMLSTKDWAAVIDKVISANNLPAMKAIYANKDICRAMPIDVLATPILNKFNENVRDKNAIEMMDLLTMPHLFPRIPADNWVGAAVIFTYNRVESPMADNIIKLVLQTPNLMELANEGMVKLLFVSIARDTELANRYLSFMFMEHNVKKLNSEDWKLLLQLFITSDNQDAIKAMNSEKSILEILPFSDQKNIIQEFKFENHLLEAGIPEKLAANGAKIASIVKNHWDSASQSIDDFQEKINIKGILKPKSRTPPKIDNALRTAIKPPQVRRVSPKILPSRNVPARLGFAKIF